MDGKLRLSIVSTKLYWPNGLTVDYPNSLLYFADAYLDFIDYCDYDGNNRKQVLASDLVSAPQTPIYSHNTADQYTMKTRHMHSMFFNVTLFGRDCNE